MNILKIKVSKDDRIYIEWEKVHTREDDVIRDKYMMECSEAPAPGLITTLQSLKEDIVAICELSTDYTEGLKVIGASFTWTENIWGAVISGVKTLKRSNAPFNIHTPWKASIPDSGQTGALHCLSNGCVKRLELLMEFAEKYIDGDRLQLPLLPQSSAEPGEADPSDPNYRVSQRKRSAKEGAARKRDDDNRVA